MSLIEGAPITVEADNVKQTLDMLQPHVPGATQEKIQTLKTVAIALIGEMTVAENQARSVDRLDVLIPDQDDLGSFYTASLARSRDCRIAI
jgi:hypothetical protein